MNYYEQKRYDQPVESTKNSCFFKIPNFAAKDSNGESSLYSYSAYLCRNNQLEISIFNEADKSKLVELVDFSQLFESDYALSFHKNNETQYFFYEEIGLIILDYVVKYIGTR